ncbi:hypothetical protein RRG08_006966 [Elysia crispata]|uniref:Uncharacterized protein n=1 Tax=Elysia crispata TaxID=231223 RepID=A0AAE1D9S6_9GAST|nr:hypothetical protein RRG08_006966 [Elysia crispata]
MFRDWVDISPHLKNHNETLEQQNSRSETCASDYHNTRRRPRPERWEARARGELHWSPGLGTTSSHVSSMSQLLESSGLGHLPREWAAPCGHGDCPAVSTKIWTGRGQTWDNNFILVFAFAHFHITVATGTELAVFNSSTAELSCRVVRDVVSRTTEVLVRDPGQGECGGGSLSGRHTDLAYTQPSAPGRCRGDVDTLDMGRELGA